MFLKQFYHLGRYTLWLLKVFSKPENHKMYYNEVLRQIEEIGFGSLKIVFIISVFVGAVTAIQLSYQFGGSLIPTYYIGYTLREMVIVDLAPTITSLVLAGKIGSSIAAEIGGMRQKEIIDAMDIMGVNTPAFLVLPKIIAALFSVPLLIILAAALSLSSGFFTATFFAGFTPADFIKGLTSFYDSYTVWVMIIKAFVFGFIIVTTSAYHGYFVKRGSIALGKAGTDAIVYSDILILVADYIIAQVMMG
ncbi:MAG TPA: ABC transporter permease [Bacteroidetes bacterium]|nr:ABC transporter permease [Bacteroidota bacterium]